MMFVLAFDHRNSFRTDFFGLRGEATPEETARLVEAKLVILDGLLHAMRTGEVKGTIGALIDDSYGRSAALRARQAGVTVAMPVEKSGRRELEFEHEPFYRELEQLRPHYAKALVRYNPTSDAALNARQRTKIASILEWTRRHGMRFMLELLVPAEGDASTDGALDFDTDIRPALTLEAVRELIRAGISADLWKLEGMGSTAQYAAIAKEVLKADSAAGCLVLGRGADVAAVDRWLRLAAPVPGFKGFAVGRTIWWEPLRAYLYGRLSRSAAVEAIAGSYLRLVRVYTGAANRGS
jgi:myo-inositol catabolism protein IolC